MLNEQLNAVFFKRKDVWIGQCLQYNIGGEALTLKGAMYDLQRSVVGYVFTCRDLGVEPKLKEAPKKYWDMWDEGTEIWPSMVAFVSPEGEMPMIGGHCLGPLWYTWLRKRLGGGRGNRTRSLL